MYGLPGVRSIHNKNLSVPNERAASAVSRYSAVVFTNPVEQMSKKSKKKTESDDDYEDDFEDEFEAYETSDEEKKDPKS